MSRNFHASIGVVHIGGDVITGYRVCPTTYFEAALSRALSLTDSALGISSACSAAHAARFKAVPGVESVFGKAGRAETATDPAPLEMFETTFQFKQRDRWGPGITLDKLIDELDRAVKFPGLANVWVPRATRSGDAGRCHDGKIIAIDKAAGTITLDHGAIPECGVRINRRSTAPAGYLFSLQGGSRTASL